LPEFCGHTETIISVVSQTVSHWLSESPNSLLHTQLELEARVGIGPETPHFEIENTRIHWLIKRTLPLLAPNRTYSFGVRFGVRSATRRAVAFAGWGKLGGLLVREMVASARWAATA
jgi:hypothetical protein